MPRINLSVPHGRTLEEAQGDLETAVPELHSQFGALVRQVTRAADHRRVRLDGVGFWGEMGTDAQDIHASGDLVLWGRLLGSHMATGLRNILQQTVQRQRP